MSKIFTKFGGPASMKTSLWRAASSIVDYDVSIVSTLALEKGGDASVVVSTLGSVVKGAGSKDLLLVIEGAQLLPMLIATKIVILQWGHKGLTADIYNLNAFLLP